MGRTMEFVSKQQTYDATRKLVLEWAAQFQDAKLESLAREMQMDGDHSQNPELYKNFLNGLTADPLEPQDALDAAAQFFEKNVQAGGNAQVAQLVRTSRATAENPEDNSAFWNHWIEILDSV